MAPRIDGPAPDGPLARPSALTGGPRAELDALSGSPAAAENLRAAAASGTAAPADRVAAAVLLAALFGDHGPAAELTSDDLADPAVTALPWEDSLRPAAAAVLGESLTTALLAWASSPSPGEPPVQAARTAADLAVDDDDRIYPKVAQRAVLLAEQGGVPRRHKDQLRDLVEQLNRARDTARQQRGAAGTGAAGASAAGASRPEPGPAAEHPEGQGTAPPAWSDQDDAALRDLLAGGTGEQGPREPRDSTGQPPSSDAPQPQVRRGRFDPRPAGTPPEDGSGMPPQGPEVPRDGGLPDERPGAPAGHETRRSYDFRHLGQPGQPAAEKTPEQRADEKDALKNWGVVALVLVLILVILGLVM